MIIKVNNEITLSQFNSDDKDFLVKYLNDIDIYKNTLKIPHPYTETDAEWWINFVEQDKKIFKRLNHFAIRNKNKDVIGGIGFHLKYGLNSLKDEIGYWLAKPYWNKGIMTEVVKKLIDLAFNVYNLKRLEAVIFIFNDASGRVLEKAGFHFEGVIKDFIEKDDQLIKGKLFAINKV